MAHRNIDFKKINGFTLIELLVVISIISLLASVVLASLNSARAKARDAKRLADMESIRTALELYYNDNNSYPITSPSYFYGNCSSFGSYPTSGSTGYIPNLAPKYISVLPLDPKPIGTTGCYLYRSDTGTDYMFLIFATVEGTVPANLKRPSDPGEQSYAIYTPGAAGY